ncbi:MAG: type II secretion system protein GspM [Undibacterium sp.]|uniref:type II secretion system protein GspM n=1 Tax=Undibacterium sp. TaxID=1914977 RepID=UPI0027214915|nr:type II secretion system protein GspM [Undibacterium sp.]MDO8653631.1 type II secretion system protein GspM [Undibacterium sp.]
MKKNVFIEMINIFWQQRNARERQFLAILTIVISVAVIYLIFVNPAISNRSKLETAIPQLRQQVSEMTAMSGQYAQIATAMTETIAPVTREVIEASLLRRGIKAQTLAASEEIVRLQVATVAYSNIMEWILEMQKAARLTVEEAKVTALPETGQVSVVLTLRQQRGAS